MKKSFILAGILFGLGLLLFGTVGYSGGHNAESNGWSLLAAILCILGIGSPFVTWIWKKIFK